jgi:hypothetical protein
MKNQNAKTSAIVVKTTLGRKKFAAISAVEGLKLDSAGLQRTGGPGPVKQRREAVLKAYSVHKGRK